MREAIVTLDDAELEALGFGGLVSRLRAAGIREVEMLEDHGRTCVPQVELGERVAPDELESFDCVDRCELVAETGDSYRYLLELTATELPEGADADHADLLGHCETTLTDRGVLVSLVGSQDAIREMLRNYEATGASPTLRSLTAFRGTADADALTDRQREVLRTAYDLGFYEVPREASTEDVAAELNIEPATVSEHLQRAERNLLARQLST